MKKITKDNTVMAAILTESGASFSEAGVTCVREMINEKFPELAGRSLIALMDKTVHTPMQLWRWMKENPELLIVVSYDGGREIELFAPRGDKTVLDHLYAVGAKDPSATAWELFARNV